MVEWSSVGAAGCPTNQGCDEGLDIGHLSLPLLSWISDYVSSLIFCLNIHILFKARDWLKRMCCYDGVSLVILPNFFFRAEYLKLPTPPRGINASSHASRELARLAANSLENIRPVFLPEQWWSQRQRAGVGISVSSSSKASHVWSSLDSSLHASLRNGRISYTSREEPVDSESVIFPSQRVPEVQLLESTRARLPSDFLSMFKNLIREFKNWSGKNTCT